MDQPSSITSTAAAESAFKPATKHEAIEARLLSCPQADHVTTHHFCPGIYIRRCLMYKGTILIGQEHKHEHFNIVLRGKCLVDMEGRQELIEGPCFFPSGVGVQKCLYIIEDTEWLTVHLNPNEERDPDKLRDMIANLSDVAKFFLSLTGQKPSDLDTQTKELQ